jgi:hypothetical protein
VEGYWTDELTYVVAVADAEALFGLWTDEDTIEAFAHDGIFDDLEWAALNPQPIQTEAEVSAIDEAIQAFSEVQWSPTK